MTTPFALVAEDAARKTLNAKLDLVTEICEKIEVQSNNGKMSIYYKIEKGRTILNGKYSVDDVGWCMGHLGYSITEQKMDGGDRVLVIRW